MPSPAGRAFNHVPFNTARPVESKAASSRAGRRADAPFGGLTYPVVLAANLTRSWLEWNTSTQPAGRSCRIKVVARDRDSEWPLSAEDSSSLNFVILRPNVLPRAELLSPPSGTVIRGAGVDLAWTGSDDDRDPLAYHVVMDGAVRSRVGGTTLHVANLSNGLHRWWVIPNDGSGNGTCLSGKWNFTFNGNLPPSASLAAPANEAIVRTRNATLAWSGADGEGDRVEYAVLLNGRMLGATASTSYEVGDLSSGTYEWTVVPSDAGGNGTCLSGTWRFTVRLNRAPDIFLLHPVNGSTSGNATVALAWSGWDPEGDALTYTLELSDGAGLNLSERLYGRNRTVGLADRTNYTWRVIVSDGIDTVASPGFAFGIRVNRPPVIHSVPVLGARRGRSYAYRVVATDPDSDALRYSLVEGPGNMGMTPDGKVLWVPWSGQAGKTFKVAIIVSDGELEERQDFTVVVSKAPARKAGAEPGPWMAAAEVALLAVAVTALWILRRRGRGRR